MSERHTPGPWHLDPPSHAGVIESDYHAVQIGACESNVISGFMSLEDARLIAAAPDMLASLRQVEAEMRAGLGSSFGETREQVRRAIAKAEGL